MHPCKRSRADLLIDGEAYRLDDLSELRTARRRCGLKGISLTHEEKTTARLEAEHKAKHRERLKELVVQRQLLEHGVRGVFGDPPKPLGG